MLFGGQVCSQYILICCRRLCLISHDKCSLLLLAIRHECRLSTAENVKGEASSLLRILAVMLAWRDHTIITSHGVLIQPINRLVRWWWLMLFCWTMHSHERRRTSRAWTGGYRSIYNRNSNTGWGKLSLVLQPLSWLSILRKWHLSSLCVRFLHAGFFYF